MAAWYFLQPDGAVDDSSKFGQRSLVAIKRMHEFFWVLMVALLLIVALGSVVGWCVLTCRGVWAAATTITELQRDVEAHRPVTGQQLLPLLPGGLCTAANAAGGTIGVRKLLARHRDRAVLHHPDPGSDTIETVGGTDPTPGASPPRGNPMRPADARPGSALGAAAPPSARPRPRPSPRATN